MLYTDVFFKEIAKYFLSVLLLTNAGSSKFLCAMNCKTASGRLRAVGMNCVSGDETGYYLHLCTERIDRRAVIRNLFHQYVGSVVGDKSYRIMNNFVPSHAEIGKLSDTQCHRGF
jgi:hypothetical protein